MFRRYMELPVKSWRDVWTWCKELYLHPPYRKLGGSKMARGPWPRDQQAEKG